MAYDTKALVMEIYQSVKRAKSLEEALEIIATIGNVEGVVVPNPSTENKDKKSEND